MQVKDTATNMTNNQNPLNGGLRRGSNNLYFYLPTKPQNMIFTPPAKYTSDHKQKTQIVRYPGYSQQPNIRTNFTNTKNDSLDNSLTLMNNPLSLRFKQEPITPQKTNNLIRSYNLQGNIDGSNQNVISRGETISLIRKSHLSRVSSPQQIINHELQPKLFDYKSQQISRSVSPAYNLNKWRQTSEIESNANYQDTKQEQKLIFTPTKILKTGENTEELDFDENDSKNGTKLKNISTGSQSELKIKTSSSNLNEQRYQHVNITSHSRGNSRVTGNFGITDISAEKDENKGISNFGEQAKKIMEKKKEDILNLFEQHHLVDHYNNLSPKKQYKFDEDLELLELDLIDLVSKFFFYQLIFCLELSQFDQKRYVHNP